MKWLSIQLHCYCAIFHHCSSASVIQRYRSLVRFSALKCSCPFFYLVGQTFDAEGWGYNGNRPLRKVVASPNILFIFSVMRGEGLLLSFYLHEASKGFPPPTIRHPLASLSKYNNRNEISRMDS